MKSLRMFLIGVACLCTSAMFAQSPASNARLQAEAKKLAEWGKDPVIIKAVKEQNAKKATLTEIQVIDKAWMDGKDTISSGLLANECARRLKQLTSKNPAYNESFVMDDLGANVCMTDRTSDYWQGDEAKWQKSFAGGKGAVFIDDRKYDSSARAVLVQISIPVMEAGKAIGAITIGVKVDELK